MIEVLQLLNEMREESSAICGSYTIRHLRKHEPLPQFGHSYPDSPLLQKEWIWLAWDRTNQPIAILIAAPTQGVVTFMRIYVRESSTRTVLVGLLRKVLADCKSRGYSRFLVYLDSNRAMEARLGEIVTKAGGSKIADCSLFAGNTDIGNL